MPTLDAAPGSAPGGHPPGHFWPVVTVVDDSTLIDERWAGTLDRDNPTGHRRTVVLPIRPGGHMAGRALDDLLGQLDRTGGVNLEGTEASRTLRPRQLAPWLNASPADDLVVIRSHWLGLNALTELIDLCAASGTRLWLLGQPAPAQASLLAAYAHPHAALNWAQMRTAWPQRAPTHSDLTVGGGASQPLPGYPTQRTVPELLPTRLLNTDPLHLNAALAASQQPWADTAAEVVAAARRRASALLAAGLSRTRRLSGGRLRTEAQHTDAYVLHTITDATVRAPTAGQALLATRGAQLAALEHGWHLLLPAAELLRTWTAAQTHRKASGEAFDSSLRCDVDPSRPAAAVLHDAGVPSVLLADVTVADVRHLRDDQAGRVQVAGQTFGVTSTGAGVLAAQHTLRLHEGAADNDPLLLLASRPGFRTTRTFPGLLAHHTRARGSSTGLHRLLGCPPVAHRSCPTPGKLTPLRTDDPTLLAARTGPASPSGAALPHTTGQLTAEQTAVALTRLVHELDPSVLRRHPGWRHAADAR